MIATPSIASLSRPTYSVPDVNRLRKSFPGRPWQNYEAGRYEVALRFAIKINKKDAGPFADFMGVELGKRGLYQEALTFFNKALELDPEYSRAWHNKGGALVNLGRHEEAIACYEKALELNPKFTNAWYNKGVALYNLGRYKEAITCYEKTLELDPKFTYAWNNKGAALGSLNRYKEAITCCEKALEFDPKCTYAWYNEGLALYNLGRHEGAITCYEKALELDPKYTEAWNSKGLALYKLDRYEEAIEKYQEALKLNRDLLESHINLAVLLSVTNRHDEAEREFGEALRLFKEKEPKRLGEALRYLEKELDTHHDSHSLWRAKGEFLQVLGREAEAKKSLERAEFYEAIRYFEANKESLLRQYEGKFVAILHDKVIDSDEDWEVLEERIIKRFGSRDLLVRKVTKEPEVIYIPTPFLVQ